MNELYKSLGFKENPFSRFSAEEELLMKYAQIAMAWAIAKGTVPIIGVTKESHVDDAVSALDVKLDPNEIITLKTVAMDTGIVIKASWEKSMK